MAEYRPAPKSRATTLVVQTAGSRIMRMSIKGWVARSSTRIQIAARPMPTANRPRVFADVQPHCWPSERGTISATSQPESSRAGTMAT